MLYGDVDLYLSSLKTRWILFGMKFMKLMC